MIDSPRRGEPIKRRSTRRAYRGLRLAVTIIVALFIIGLTSPPIFAVGILPPANPAANIAPHPNFDDSGECTSVGASVRCPNPCVSTTGHFPAFDDGHACALYVLRAINAARATEHVRAMVLPTNWQRLSVTEQLFVLADLERTARGLPPYLGLNRTLSNTAQRAALLTQDPGLAPGFAVEVQSNGVVDANGTFAAAETVLEADYGWMYEDGWGGSVSATSNFDCTSASAPSCWGHRDALLGMFDNGGVGLSCRTCELGTGFALVHGESSFTDLLERPRATPPPMYFTWARNVAPYLHG